MKPQLRKTKIIGTIGPASESEEMFTKLVNAGLNVARINFSHGGFEENKSKIETIKAVREKLGKPVALMLDTKGPEIRTGVLETGNEKIQINEGQTFTFVNEDILGNNEKVSVTYKNLYQEVKVGTIMLVDDGVLQFEVKEIKDKDIICKALNTAKLGSRKTINIPSVNIQMDFLSDKDTADIIAGIPAGFDYIAASFVRRAQDVRDIKELLKKHGGERIKIISKIECQEGIENFDEILEESDGIMVARGDMGVEVPMEEVPIHQKEFIKKCNKAGKPVVTATQMLESMTLNPRPTRAEVSDVANAVYDVTSDIMLSGECATGKYPVECIKTMVKISKAIENSTDYWDRFYKISFDHNKKDIEDALVYTTCVTAEQIQADAIVAYTHTGRSIEKLASLASKCPIFAITDDEKTYNQLSLVFNTTPVLCKGENSIDETINAGIEKLKNEGELVSGDMVVLAGGASALPKQEKGKVIGGCIKI